MSIEMLVEATVSAIVSAMANDVWPTVRGRIAQVFCPDNPDVESAYLDRLSYEAPTDEGRRRELVRAYVLEQLRRYSEPEREYELYRELSVAIGEIGQVVFEAENPEVRVAAPGSTFRSAPLGGEAPDRIALATGPEDPAARILDGAPLAAPATRVWATPTEAAAKRLALMPSAEKLLSGMDSKLAASLLAAMAPPRPAEIFVRLAPERGAAILGEMDAETAVRRITEIADADLGIAARLLCMMPESAANLLSAMVPPYPAELLGRMAPDPAAQILAAMSIDHSVVRLAELKPEFAASVLAKVDKVLATGLLTFCEPRRAAELLALMAPSAGAELLASMEVSWAHDRLTEMSADRALKLLVALRPPHALMSIISGQLAMALLGEAVVTLARLAGNQALLESAHTEAARIRAEAKAQAQQILKEAEGPLDEAPNYDLEEGAGRKPKPASTLAEEIMDRLSHRKNQTVAKLAASLHVSPKMISEELDRLLENDKVTVSYKYRGGVSYYSAR
jgi:flagellar motility protein MotE (MotC chaperone)